MLRKDLEKVSADLRAAQDEQVLLAARIEGLLAQRDALQRAVLAAKTSADDVDLGSMTKARAIVTILKAAPRPMTLGDIATALTDAGKQSTSNGVSVYINDLLKNGSVIRVERGHYVASPR